MTRGAWKGRWRGAARGAGRWSLRLAAFLLVAAVAVAVWPGCSLGEGQGYVTGTLNVPMCWSGPFNLSPNFFAAVPYNSACGIDAADPTFGEVSELEIRIQNGTDYETFSDGILILVDNVHAVRGDPPYKSELNQPLALGLPPGVVPPGTPIPAVPNPPAVSLTLYLNASCQTEQIALYALDSVTLNADGSCNPTDAGPLTLQCEAGVEPRGPDAEAGTGSGAGAGAPDAGSDSGPGPVVKTASSTITFQALFDGNPYESNAAQRLTQATFDAYLGDPRDGCPGGLGPPPPCRGHIQGSFSFYFERGQPAQPFQ
jgi:hypothetical protein